MTELIQNIINFTLKTYSGTWVGNRIATAMAYLSDVEGMAISDHKRVIYYYILTGGFTAFPNLGVAAKPQKVRDNVFLFCKMINVVTRAVLCSGTI